MGHGYQLFPLELKCGPLGKKKLGAVLDKHTIQFCNPTRYGFQPEDLTSLSCDWGMTTMIYDVD